jgi:hypothetical protein
MIASRSWWPFLAAVVVSGCFKTTIRSGYPPDDPPQQWEDRWHSGWLLGAIEASGPHDLSRACPGGWSQIETVTDPSQSLITLLTIGIYTPQTVTVVCAVKPSPALSPPPPRKL